MHGSLLAMLLSGCLFVLLCFYYQGPAPALVKAEVPWSARRGTLSDKERVLKTVKGYHIMKIFILIFNICMIHDFSLFA
jgi:hypothetical protein